MGQSEDPVRNTGVVLGFAPLRAVVFLTAVTTANTTDPGGGLRPARNTQDRAASRCPSFSCTFSSEGEVSHR